ncbi:MAG: hypothetical protein QNK37_38810 [Acidobacteriota bacterium]|nr:hypothetical protein [Acidobacteriota bacterium]
MAKSSGRRTVERVQTGIRIEKRLLKVLRGLAEYTELSMGDLLEGIVLHAFEGKSPFKPETIKIIEDLKKIYGLDYGAESSHKLIEKEQ